MKRLVVMGFAVVLVGCGPGSETSNHQNLNFAECKRLADETARSGKLNFDLCPGYMPDGYPVE
ncbi:MAG: hypothetical protein ACPGFC_12355, partial [Paracoccaceae bacterium]